MKTKNSKTKQQKKTNRQNTVSKRQALEKAKAMRKAKKMNERIPRVTCEVPKITDKKIQVLTNSSFSKAMLPLCFKKWITIGNAEIRCIDKNTNMIELRHNGAVTTYKLF